jgi:multidrug efflux system membrane fusion protein
MNRPLLLTLLLCLLTAPALAEEFPAVLDWSQRAVLSTPVSGVIRRITVHPGQRVQAGQVLLELDQRPFTIAVREAQAQVHKQALQRDEARRQLQRTRELYDRRVIAEHDLQLEEIAAAAAESDYTSAVAVRDTAKLQLEYSTVTAPFPGIVTEVPVAAGMTVVNTQQATPLVSLVQNRPMYARVQLPGALLGGLQPGHAATVIINGTRFPGKLEQVGAEPDSSGRFALAFSFDPGATPPDAGMPARVEIAIPPGH